MSKLKLKSKGFSLMEVMVSMGLMGIVSVGLMQMTKQQADVQKKSTMSLDSQSLRNEILTILSDEEACTNTFKGMKKGEVKSFVSGVASGIKNRAGSVAVEIKGMSSTTTTGADGVEISTGVAPSGTYLKSFVIKELTQIPNSTNYQAKAIITTANGAIDSKKPMEISFNAVLVDEAVDRCYKNVDGLYKSTGSLVLSSESDSTTGNIEIKASGASGSISLIPSGTGEINLQGNVKISNSKLVVGEIEVTTNGITVDAGESNFAGKGNFGGGIASTNGLFVTAGDVSFGPGLNTFEVDSVSPAKFSGANVTGALTANELSVLNEAQINILKIDTLDAKTSGGSITTKANLVMDTGKTISTNTISNTAGDRSIDLNSTKGIDLNPTSNKTVVVNGNLEVTGFVKSDTLVNNSVVDTEAKSGTFKYLHAGFENASDTSSQSPYGATGIALNVKNKAYIDSLETLQIQGGTSNSTANLYLNPSGGNVGIGKTSSTISPDYKLDVTSGAIGAKSIKLTNGTDSVLIDHNSISGKNLVIRDEPSTTAVVYAQFNVMRVLTDVSGSGMTVDAVPSDYPICSCDTSNASPQCYAGIESTNTSEKCYDISGFTFVPAGTVSCSPDGKSCSAPTATDVTTYYWNLWNLSGGIGSVTTAGLRVSNSIITNIISAVSVTTSSFTNLSDKRIKEDIKEVEPQSVDKLQDVKIHQYNLISDKSKRTRFGVIAQELEALFPELIQNGQYKSVDYMGLFSLLLKFVLNQSESKDKLNADIDELKKENKLLKDYICKKDKEFCQ